MQALAVVGVGHKNLMVAVRKIRTDSKEAHTSSVVAEVEDHKTALVGHSLVLALEADHTGAWASEAVHTVASGVTAEARTRSLVLQKDTSLTDPKG